MDKVNRVNYNIRLKNKENLPILYVRFSNKHVRSQLIIDNKIIFEISSLNCRNIFIDDIKPYNLKGAIALGKVCGERMKKDGYNRYVLNRGDKKYIGVLKAFNESVKLVVGGNNE